MKFSKFLGLVIVVTILSIALISCTQAPVTPTTPASTPTTQAPTTPKPTTPAATPTTQALTPTPTASATLKQGVIKVGLSTAMSGGAVGWGLPLDQAWRIVVDKFNKDGGVVIGDTRYTITIITYDDQYDSKKAVANITKLIYDDKVDIVATFGGTSALATLPIVTEAKKLSIAYAQLEPAVQMTPPHPMRYAIVVCNLAQDAADIHNWVAKNRPQMKKLALLARDDSVGRPDARISTEIATKAGIQVVATEYYDPKATDFTPQLRKILAANPDYMDFCATSPANIGLIVKQARELGYKGGFFDSSIGDLAASAAIAGEQNFMGFVQSGAAPSQGIPPEWVDFVGQYVAKYGLPFNTATINRTNAPYTLIAALKGARSLDADTLISWLQKNHFQTITGDSYLWGTKTYGIKDVITSPLPISEYVGGGQTKLLGWTKTQPEE